MKRVIHLSTLLIVLGLIGFFVSPVIASITITTNDDSGDQNVNTPIDTNQNSSGITITANGESGEQNVDVSSQPNQNNNGVTITNVVTSNSSNNINEGNSVSPTIAPSTSPAENQSTSGGSSNKISNSPTITISVSPSPTIKPTAANISNPNKFINRLKFFSKIWNGISSIVGKFFHSPF